MMTNNNDYEKRVQKALDLLQEQIDHTYLIEREYELLCRDKATLSAAELSALEAELDAISTNREAINALAEEREESGFWEKLLEDDET